MAEAKGPIAITLDAGGVAGFGPSPQVSGWLFLPSRIDPAEPQTVAVCLHGGGYGKRYYHIEVPGCDGYSMCRHLAERGVIAVTIDGLDTGNSSHAESAELVTWQTLALAHDAAVRALADSLRAGTLVLGLPPLARLNLVGVGHSLGGMQLSVQQGRHRSFDRLAVLGWANLGLALPPSALTPVPDAGGTRSFSSPALRREFHLPDVPTAVLESLAERENFPVSLTLAGQLRDLGKIREMVRSIDVPIFVCFAERDTSPSPHEEPGVYTGSSDVTLFILAGSAHCHNFATTRAVLWDRLLTWMR